MEAVFDLMEVEGGEEAAQQLQLVPIQDKPKAAVDEDGWALYPGLEGLEEEEEELEEEEDDEEAKEEQDNQQENRSATVAMLFDDEVLRASLQVEPHSAGHHAISSQAKAGRRQKGKDSQQMKPKAMVVKKKTSRRPWW